MDTSRCVRNDKGVCIELRTRVPSVRSMPVLQYVPEMDAYVSSTPDAKIRRQQLAYREDLVSYFLGVKENPPTLILVDPCVRVYPRPISANLPLCALRIPNFH